LKNPTPVLTAARPSGGIDLSGATKAALILKALKSGVEAAARDLAEHATNSGCAPLDPATAHEAVKDLIQEFTLSLSRIDKPKRDSTSPVTPPKAPDPAPEPSRPFAPYPGPVSKAMFPDTPEKFAARLCGEHSGVIARGLGMANDDFATRTLRLMEPLKAQQVALHLVDQTRHSSPAADAADSRQVT